MVYRARMRGEGGFNKDVALKIMRRDRLPNADEIARRLRDEARILGMIRHRAVVGVDGLARFGSQWAVVMEYVEGVDLKQVRTHYGVIPVTVALEVVAEVASALHHAYHAKGPDGAQLNLMHRDIKPGNIRLTAAGAAKVLDFGIAKGDFAGREAFTRQVAFGSLGYIPQERVDGNDTPTGDVYALGAVLYELVVGKPYGQTQMSVRRHERRMAERVKILKRLLVAPEVVQLIVDMMSFSPDRRPLPAEVERRAVDLSQAIHGPRLREWSANNVERLVALAEEAEPQDELVGRVLTEELGQARHSVDPPPPELSREGRRLRVVAVGAIVLVTSAVVLVAMFVVAMLGVFVGQLL
ncbi:MAG: serine/threonine protein kinase [Myxococcales bacterium]|nr:serine/threonine protein kinase [Myxococcales bacterium]